MATLAALQLARLGYKVGGHPVQWIRRHCFSNN